MAQKLTAALPPELDLDDLYTIRVAAIDPATGDDVAGVVVSNVQIVATNIGAAADASLEVGPFMLVPGPDA